MIISTWPVIAFLATVEAVLVVVTPHPQQEIVSFGASGALWPNDLIVFPEDVQANLSKLLFSSDGLQLSSYRYNMGGYGGEADSKAVTDWRARVESFLRTDGTYDWSRDHTGITFLKEAQKYKVPYITFFSNAVPSHIAHNKASCGYDFKNSKTKPTSVADYVLYIQAVLEYWSRDGINIAYMSPINEPDNSHADCSQEGMAMPAGTRSVLFQKLKWMLSQSNDLVNIQTVGYEQSSIAQTMVKYSQLCLSDTARNLDYLSVHNYDFPTDAELLAYRNLTHNLIEGTPPPLKFTSTCCATNAGNGPGVFGKQYDPTMTNALIVARQAWQFLTLLDAVSFDWWTAVAYLPCSPTLDGPECATNIYVDKGYNSGLIYIDPQYNQTQDYTLYLTKRFWAMKHFSYFIRPGSMRYSILDYKLPDGVKVIVTKKADTWNALFVNNHTDTVPIELDLSGLQNSEQLEILRTTVTDPDDDWKQIEGKSAPGHDFYSVRHAQIVVCIRKNDNVYEVV